MVLFGSVLISYEFRISECGCLVRTACVSGRLKDSSTDYTDCAEKEKQAAAERMREANELQGKEF